MTLGLVTTVSGFFDFAVPEAITISGPVAANGNRHTIKVEAASEIDARKALLDLLAAVEAALGFSTKAQPWIDLKKGERVTVRYKDTEQLFVVCDINPDGSFNLEREEA